MKLICSFLPLLIYQFTQLIGSEVNEIQNIVHTTPGTTLLLDISVEIKVDFNITRGQRALCELRYSIHDMLYYNTPALISFHW